MVTVIPSVSRSSVSIRPGYGKTHAYNQDPSQHAKNIKTFDFSLYPIIPQPKLIDKLKESVQICFI